MTIKKKAFTRGIILPADDVGVDGIEGELKVGATSKKLQAYLEGALRSMVSENQTQTLTNKSIDADTNTIANLEVDNLKAGVLDTDLTSVSAAHDTLPSAKATKAYVDSVASTTGSAAQAALDAHLNDTVDAHDASAISSIPAGNLAATDVQGALNELQSDIDTRATITTSNTKITGPASATDNALVRYDSTTGKLAKNSVVTVSDTGAAAGFTTINASGTITTSAGVSAASVAATGAISGASVAATGNVSGTQLIMSGDVSFGGKFETSVANDATTGSNATLTSPTTRVVRLTSGSLVSLDGIAASLTGNTEIILENISGNPITINNDTGTAANRIYTGTGASITLAHNASLLISYDFTSSKWRVIGGSGASTGGGTTDPDVLLVQTFDTASTADFTQTGLSLITTGTLHGAKTAKLTHQAGVNQSFAQTIAVDPKFRGVNITASVLLRSTASSGNVTFAVNDLTNSTVLTSQSLETNSQAIASLTTTISSTTVSGFTTSNINTLSVGMSVTGTGIAAGTTISAISTSALTITLSAAATASGTVTLRISALPKTIQLGFAIPANCSSISYTVTALPETGAETFIDDVALKNYFMGTSVEGQNTVSISVPSIQASTDYVPTFTGLGTVTVLDANYSRNGEFLEGNFSVNTGTHTAVLAKFSLPPGLTTDTTKSPNNCVVGNAGSNFTPFDARLAVYNSDTSSIYIVADDKDISAASLGTEWANNNIFTGSFRVAIQGWSATTTQSFTTTDLVPAKAVLGNTTINVPASTDWASYTPVITSNSGAMTNATPSAKWRREGSDILVTGQIAFSAASAAFSGINVSLPNGYTIDTNDLLISGYPTLGGVTYYDFGAGFYTGDVYINSTSNVHLYVRATTTHTGNVPLTISDFSNTMPVTIATGDTISFEFRFPAVGLSATSEVVVSGTQSALVQAPDSEIILTSGTLAAANGSIATGFALSRCTGTAFLFATNRVTVQVDGTYSITASCDGSNSTGIVLYVNGSQYGSHYSFGNTAGSQRIPLALTTNLRANDYVEIRQIGSVAGTGVALNITQQGALKVATVNADQKITIPTSELRFEGSSSLGTGSETAIVKFTTLAKIRGDAYTVDNTNGTKITMTKAGRLTIGASLYFGGTNAFIYVSKNQAVLTTVTATAAETLAAAGASASTGTASPAASASWTGDVNVGDVLRISSLTAPVSNPINSLNLSFQEQKIQVSVSNTLPQFSESDSVVRVSGAGASPFGSIATSIRRFSTVAQNLGTDVEYTDSPTLGGQFKAVSSGIYNVSYSEESTSNVTETIIAIQVNGSNVAYDNQVTNTASTASKRASCSWSGYLNQGDIVQGLAGNANGSGVIFTMSKVGKPNVTGVNVTPFIQIPQPLSQSSYLFSATTYTAGQTVVGALGRSTGEGIYSYNATTGVYTMLKNAKITIAAGAGTSSASAGEIYIRVDGSTVNASTTETSTSGVFFNASYSEILSAGQTFYVNVGAGTIGNWRISVSAEAKSDQILTAVETFSTDNAPLTYAGSGTYTATTLANAPVGTFITYTRAASSNARTQTTTAPTQTSADMNTNGILLYSRAYNASSTAAQPVEVSIQIGKGMKGVSLRPYFSTGKTVEATMDWMQSSATTEIGSLFTYNEITGILTIDGGTSYSGASTTRYIGSSAGGNVQATAYFTVNASKNPALTGMGISTIAARAVSSTAPSFGTVAATVTYDSAKTYDTLGALNSATGVFVAPETGYYSVSAFFLFQSAAYTAGQRIFCTDNNGVFGEVYVAQAAGTRQAPARYNNVVYLPKGSSFYLLLTNERGATAIDVSPTLNYFSISKIGN